MALGNILGFLDAEAAAYVWWLLGHPTVLWFDSEYWVVALIVQATVTTCGGGLAGIWFGHWLFAAWSRPGARPSLARLFLWTLPPAAVLCTASYLVSFRWDIPLFLLNYPLLAILAGVVARRLAGRGASAAESQGDGVLSFAYPLASLLRLLRSPAYRLTMRPALRGKTLALVLFVIFAAFLAAGLWLFSAAALGEWSGTYFTGFWTDALLLRFGAVCLMKLIALALGLQIFAPERRSDALDQLLLTPLPRNEVAAARLLSGLVVALPCMFYAIPIDLVILPSAGERNPETVLMLAGSSSLWLAAGAVWALAMGMKASLSPRMAPKLVAFLLVVVSMGVDFGFLRICRDDTLRYLAWGAVVLSFAYAGLAYWRVKATARRFDEIALDEPEGAAEPVISNPSYSILGVVKDLESARGGGRNPSS